MTGFESFVGVNPWTALFTFCNMLITFAVLKKFLFKPVKKMIDDRQQEIDTMYADADAAKQKAADLEKEYADHLQSIKDERDAMLREATARAQKREEEIVGEARAEAASIRAAAAFRAKTLRLCSTALPQAGQIYPKLRISSMTYAPLSTKSHNKFLYYIPFIRCFPVLREKEFYIIITPLSHASKDVIPCRTGALPQR